MPSIGMTGRGCAHSQGELVQPRLVSVGTCVRKDGERGSLEVSGT